jgi:hypothetical protein
MATEPREPAGQGPHRVYVAIAATIAGPMPPPCDRSVGRFNGHMADRKNDPNYLPAAENHRELNEAFYRARPHAYFNQRLETLVLIAGKSGQLDELLAQGVTLGRLKAGGAPTPDLTEHQRAEAEQDRERFVIAEAEVLLHHAAETLLRLYLAHEGLPPCPWLVRRASAVSPRSRTRSPS